MYTARQYLCMAAVAVVGLVSTYAVLDFKIKLESDSKVVKESLLERAVKALEKSNDIDLRRK